MNSSFPTPNILIKNTIGSPKGDVLNKLRWSK